MYYDIIFFFLLCLQIKPLVGLYYLWLGSTRTMGRYSYIYCASTAGQPPLGLYYGQVFVCASTSGQPLVGMYFVLIFIC